MGKYYRYDKGLSPFKLYINEYEVEQQEFVQEGNIYTQNSQRIVQENSSFKDKKEFLGKIETTKNQCFTE